MRLVQLSQPDHAIRQCVHQNGVRINLSASETLAHAALANGLLPTQASTRIAPLSTIAKAIASNALLQGYRVQYGGNRRVLRPLSPERAGTTQSAAASPHRPDLLLFDDLPSRRASLRAPANCCSGSSIHATICRSMIVTSNRVIQDWGCLSRR